jgi:ATP-dependent exoDNAse (exonuclease V) beta subunit
MTAKIEKVVEAYAGTGKDVDLDPRTHTYTYRGERYYHGALITSVTQFLEVVKNRNYESVPVHRRNNAALVGSLVHAVTEAIDNGEEFDEWEMCHKILSENGYISSETTPSEIEHYIALMSNDIANFKKTYIDGMKFYGIEHYACEVRVFNKELGYAGTIDRISVIGDEPYIIDIKTSKNIEHAHRLQVIAYGMCSWAIAKEINYAILQLKKTDSGVQFNLEKFKYNSYLEEIVRAAKKVHEFCLDAGLM